MTDEQIEEQRVAGDIVLVLRAGTEEERESLLRVIERIAPEKYQVISDWVRDGMPGA